MVMYIPRHKHKFYELGVKYKKLRLIFDGDHHGTLVGVGFKSPPREEVTIDSVLQIIEDIVTLERELVVYYPKLISSKELFDYGIH